MRTAQPLRYRIVRFMRSKAGHRQEGFSLPELGKRVREENAHDLRVCLKALASEGLLSILGKTRWTRYLQGPCIWDEFKVVPSVETRCDTAVSQNPAALVKLEKHIDLVSFTPDITLTCLAILGLSPGITLTELQRERRRLMSENHPDRGGDPNNFRTICDTFKVLDVITTDFQSAA